MIKIDLEKGEVAVETEGRSVSYPLGTAEAFAIISELWLRSGWDTKYVYGFTWLGRPIIQLPEDMIRIQEVIYRVRPDVIIETGVAHGGSLVFYASLCKAMGRGRVIGIDVEIRPHNRKAIEAHELFEYITLVEGSSVDPQVVRTVKSLTLSGETALVVLDSNHTKEHVLGELRAYSELVSVGSYIVACDGIMGNIVGAPRTNPDWGWNNPRAAAEEFARENGGFVIEEPEIPFNEGIIKGRVSYWPGGFLRRIR
ncbi:MAG: class I SAM-dependent methyltransferase [Deltaproteobacteria bacterium]|nr:class I SAM-dependent methyltransferase [Deltaproteobacteria bacterium]MBI2539990.1 class I SAM-dependent methyltransferase [Deltaproteobacteria bacterium]MBI2991096.1 class I SAM-dependent methyltransferase [Deltaproteobacteria bacterium]